MRRLSKSDSGSTNTCVPGAVKRWRQKWTSAGDWRLSQAALTKSLDIAGSQERATERRGGDGEERREAKQCYEVRVGEPGQRKRKIARQSIILSTGNNLLGGEALGSPHRCRLGCARWPGYKCDDRGGHQGER